jgi:predicted O-linked N-acetylglucosamine transferase (SPINDLY family)
MSNSEKHSGSRQEFFSEGIVTIDTIVKALVDADWTGAEHLCRQCLARGETVTILAHLAFALRRQGRIEEALETYRRALVIPGASAEVWFNYGNLLSEQGERIEAENAFEAALKIRADLVPALLQFARCARDKKEWVEADGRYERLLGTDPKNFSGWLEAGNVARQMGNTEKMLSCYRNCTDVAPRRWEGFVSLGRALEEQHEHEEADIAFRKALNACGNNGERRDIYAIMGKNRLERGDLELAEEALRSAIDCARQETPVVDENILAELRIDFAQTLWRMGKQEAFDEYSKASLATSEPALSRLAEQLFRNNQWEQSITVLRRCAGLHPESGSAHWNLANALERSWQLEEALEVLSIAESIAPMPGAKAMRANIASRMGDTDAALALYRELAETEEPFSAVRCSAAMCALYSEHLSPEEVADIHRELFSAWGNGARDRTSFRNSRKPDRPLRIGLVTADFHHQHPVNIFMQPLLRMLDRTAFTVSVYNVSVSHDDQTDLARSRVSSWVECTSWSDIRLANRIEEDGVDILINLSGHTAYQRGRLFAHRAAPVQVTFLGYPGSTGLPNMDWIIGDPAVTAPAHDHLYSEKVIRLPHTVFCFAPEERYPYPLYGSKHAGRILTFGSFNNAPKITLKTVHLWARVLRAVPDSRLLLKAPSFGDKRATDRFTKLFAKCGIDSERIEYRGPVGLDAMMAEYADIDIALDTVPYNGGTTTHQALWMGVPAVALEGGNFASRMGASIMQAAGLPEWVARDEDDYVEIAVRRSANRHELLELKRGLRERLLAAPGWNIETYAREFEHVLRIMWKAWCSETHQLIQSLPP